MHRHPAYFHYLYAVSFLGLFSILYAFWQLPKQTTSCQWLILAILTIVTSTFSVKIPAVNSKITIGDTLILTNTVLFGPAAGTLTAGLDAIVGSLYAHTKRRRLEYICFNVGTMATSALTSGTVFFHLLGRGPLYANPTHSFYEILFPLGALGFTHYLCNSGSVATIVALEVRKSVREIWMDSFLWTSITYLAGAATAGFAAVYIGSMTPEVFAVIVPVLLAVYFTYKTYLDKVREVRSLAYYDSLTSLPNRVLFVEHLNQAIAQARHSKQNLAIMFLDLDNFKRINDTYGHCFGDLLVQSVAVRLTRSVRTDERNAQVGTGPQDVIIGRFGGDEFTVLLTGIYSTEEAAKIAERLLESFTNPFSLEGHEASVAASIGVSIYPFDGEDADTLLKNADTAMFYAKEHEKNGYRFYSHSMNEMSPERLLLENDLRKALLRKEFKVFYQPKVDAESGLLTGAEALVRWQHPTRGLLTAAEFIPMAEETGLIRPIGEWVLRTTCMQISQWLSEGLTPVPVAVNLSAVQLKQQGLTRLIADIIRDANLDGSLLELEITEGTIMKNEEEADRSLRELRALGVKISIDDFGSGYSSLSRLRRFSLDALKIDHSFVADLAQNPDDRAITAAIIAMATSLNLKVIAEGVETEKQLRLLREQGCHEIQGWVYSKALPAEQFAMLLHGNRHCEPTYESARLSPSNVVVADQRFKPEHDWHATKPSTRNLPMALRSYPS
jgi:diguanylate cyclase (GGDEF)-like protein